MTYCLIPSERCVEIKYFNKNLFYLNSTARAKQNRLACHFGHACHRFASAGIGKNKIIHLDQTVLEISILKSGLCEISRNAFGGWGHGIRDISESILNIEKRL